MDAFNNTWDNIENKKTAGLAKLQTVRIDSPTVLRMPTRLPSVAIMAKPPKWIPHYKNEVVDLTDPDGATKNEIDFIMSTKKKLFNDASAIHSVKIASDHRMACRGKRRDAGKTVPVSRQSNGVPAKPTSPKPSSRNSLEADADSTDHFDSESNDVLIVPSHADNLVLYACAKGYVSYRSSAGSWMIQALCRQIEEFHKNEHILDIITRVNKEVAGITSGKNHKQMPHARYTLTSKFKI